MDVSTIEILIAGVVLLIALYYYLIKTYNFWESRKIVGPKPILIFGNIKDLILGKYSFGTFLKNIQEQYPNAPMIGVYVWRKPAIILNDPDQIKNVLIKDFESFVDRGLLVNEELEPLSTDLASLDPERWRLLRTKLTPAFTPNKLREMFYLLIECADQLDDYLNRLNNQLVDMRNISAKFTIDVISACAFGLQANALSDEGSIFYEMGKRTHSTGLKNVLKVRLQLLAPNLFNLIGGFLVDYDLTKFFISLTRDTVERRKKNCESRKRNDLIDLLIAIREDPKQVNDIELTDPVMAAQLFIFFFAGFSPSSSTMSNCFLELAMNHEIQDKVRKEIQDEFSITNGEMTYEGIKNMKYLDKVVNETLRKYSPIPVITRKSIVPYTFPGTNVSIPIGTRVWIPTSAIHHDLKNFPNPDKFDPERFDGVELGSRSEMSFLPFGKGPRNCIGAHFGLLQVKVGIVKVLQNHILDVCDRTDINYEIEEKVPLLTPKNGIILKITKKQI